MTAHLRIAILVCLFIGTHTQEFDLFDALDADPVPTPAKPKSKDTDDLDLFDALAPETVTEKPKPPIAPPKDGGAGGFDILDAFDNNPKKPEPKKPGDAKPDKPAVVPPKNGGTGGGSFGDSDLFDISEGSDYKPDGGRSGGRASVPANDPNQGGADQPQEAGPGQIAGIASAIGMALMGAASSYFAYQKKKLCFKVQGGQDPESGKNYQGAQSEPQVMSNLLRSS